MTAPSANWARTFFTFWIGQALSLFGTQLVQFALDDVRSTGRRVEPRCWYVAEFIATNPEYADLAS